MDKDLLTIFALLSKDRDEIREIIGERNENILFFDTDSEDEGTEFPEVALLRLVRNVFLQSECADDIISSLAKELSWLLSLVLGSFDVGICLFVLESEYDYLWEICQRYSKIALEKYDVKDCPDFLFESMLKRYGYDVLPKHPS